jgi:predicted MFS family arabinose efflux permease
MVPAGVAMAFANPGTNRWASAAPTAAQQATLVGIAQAGVQAGALLAGGLAAAAAIGLDWRGALQVGALLALVGAVLAWRSPADHRTAADRGTEVAATAVVLRSVRRLALYALLMGAGTSTVLAYLPSFAVDRVGLTNAAAGATVVVYGATALLCRLGLGALLRRVGDVGPGLLVAMALGAGAALLVIGAGARNPGWLWAGAVVFGATGTTWPAVAYLAVVRVSPPGGAGRAAGWMTAAFYVGLWVGPPAAGQIIVRQGYGWVWAAAVVCYLLALLPASRTNRPVPLTAAAGTDYGAIHDGDRDASR